ncbi:hypothetical protein GGH94_002692 [Coemansia aciculifera]|uniref:pyridoxal 5'-phosphate synthase (glutamine hydrolyzing) n=1 Tax=Coemansia aciculifera TaxID=417176 RepID=A0A9W8M5R5_9FUNG|nr:hypothetical protein GGH94_002692 [Coemansia aciculifera]KAJ2874380.1 hypothetical protein GGH93_002446 [Coemansia aciculifera]
MATKAEKERDARIAARQQEAKKKKDEKAAKEEIAIGHDIEAGVAIKAGANFVDESEFAIMGALPTLYIDNKGDIPVPVICGVGTLADCLKRRKEGASILRIRQTSAVRADATVVTLNNIDNELKKYQGNAVLREMWLEMHGLEEADFAFLKDAEDISPLRIYAYGGICTPRDVALMMHMHCAGVFVDNSVFTSDNPRKRLKAMARAVERYDDIDEIIKLSIGTAERM